jgi:hypothetical protein
MGVAGVIAKPFDPLTISTQIAKILGWNSERSRLKKDVTHAYHIKGLGDM